MIFKKLNNSQKTLYIIFVFGVCFLMVSLIKPLFGDEVNYNKLANSMLLGKYYLNDKPSVVTPVIPFLYAIFKTSFSPEVGFVLNKVFHIIITLFGLRYIYFFLLNQKINNVIALAIVALTLINPVAINWLSTLYPESIIFFCFWGFMYHISLAFSKENLVKMLFFFIVLILTRYVFAVLGVVVLIKYYDYLKSNFRIYKFFIAKMTLLAIFPVFFWGKYLYGINRQNSEKINYFKRYEVENPILYNIKCGLGFEKHHLVSRINGIPAFVSLFVPKTGLRNYTVSVLLILLFIFGFFVKTKTKALKLLFLSIILVMLGYIIAGTGFSRYWLPLLPGFLIGYYFVLKKIGLSDKVFLYLVYFSSFVYIINSIRVSLMIINNNI